MGENGAVSTPGETYEEWRARTAPATPVRTFNPRTWDWGVIALLGVFFAVVGGGWGTAIGLSLPLVLAVEAVLHGRLDPDDVRRDRVLRGATLLATLALSGLIIWVDGGFAAVLPVLLVLLDLKDDRSFLRSVYERRRARRA
ncbi:MAG: hypothetical protein JWR90_3325 [Marmoricola sp.]|jgi:hypothetical protein|nr:hypothetical protein [Marmoricola sp.]